MARKRKLLAGAVVASVVTVTGLVSLGGAQSAWACTKSATGKPGNISYTLKVTDTCDATIFRSIIIHEDFWGRTHTDAGAWIHNGNSVAHFPAADSVVRYGYQYQLGAHGYTIWR